MNADWCKYMGFGWRYNWSNFKSKFFCLLVLIIFLSLIVRTTINIKLVCRDFGPFYQLRKFNGSDLLNYIRYICVKRNVELENLLGFQIYNSIKMEYSISVLILQFNYNHVSLIIVTACDQILNDTTVTTIEEESHYKWKIQWMWIS